MPSLLYAAAGVNRAAHVADAGVVELQGAGAGTGPTAGSSSHPASGHDGPHIVSTFAYAAHKSVIFCENLQSPGNAADTGGESATAQPPAISSIVHVGTKAPISALRFLTRATTLPENPHAASIAALAAGCSDGSVHLLVPTPLSQGSQQADYSARADALVRWIKVGTLPYKHAGSVSTLAAVHEAHGKILLITGGSDGKVRSWALTRGDDGQVSIPSLDASSEIDLGGPFPLAACVAMLPGQEGRALLALGITQKKITVYLQDATSSAAAAPTFARVAMLEGHDDWVRSVDICSTTPASRDGGEENLVLATASQDGCVRLWRIKRRSQSGAGAAVAEHKDAFEKLAEKIEEDRADDRGISTKAHTFSTGETTAWTISFDALLIGHDGWVNDVRWAPAARRSQAAALLSAGADGSAILWTPSGSPSADSSDDRLLDRGFVTFEHAHALADDALWTPSARFGEVGGVTTGGFYGCLWLPRNRTEDQASAVLAHAWNGAIHLFRKADQRPQAQWAGAPTVGGHQGMVKGLDWEPEGRWFLTTGNDRTTRIHGRWPRGSRPQPTWHEIARPQIHGYDINAAAWLDPLNFASAAEEKVVRVFSAPQGFVDTTTQLGADSAEESRARPGLALIVRADSLQAIIRPWALQRVLQDLAARLGPGQSFSIVVVSPLFDALLGDQPRDAAAPSFEQLEQFLKWTYAQIWSVCVKQDRLDVDISVFLLPKKREAELESLLDKAESVFVVKGLEPAVFPADLSLETLAPGGDGDPLCAATGSALEQQRSIALGGTFDHLHVGHKILLSMAALICTERIIVGITTDVMLKKKSNAHLLEDLPTRIARVDDFIRRFRQCFSPVRQDVVELSDVAGPAGSEPDLDALLVTDETQAGGDMIDNVRKENGLRPLIRYCIGVIGAAGETKVEGKDAAALAASKVGSTAIRKWLAKKASATSEGQHQSERPVGASVPPLGLSNRAVYEGRAVEDTPSASGHPIGSAQDYVSTTFQRPPTEAELVAGTLWPELDKLYGHGSETFSVGCSPDGRFCASSCKASSADHAVIRVYDRQLQWKDVAVLPGHSLSITRIRFSPNGQYILSVSRDRSWRLYRRAGESFEPVSAGEKAHSKIVWDAAWLPSTSPNSVRFATASRDKTVKVWTGPAGSVQVEDTIALPGPVTAIAASSDGSTLAAGLETGMLHELQRRDGKWQSRSRSSLHTEAIAALQFRPGRQGHLAVVAEDSLVQLVAMER